LSGPRRLACIRGQRTEVYPWDRVEQVFYKPVAIDAYAIKIRLKFGMPPLRFTGCHFNNLKQFWLRLQH